MRQCYKISCCLSQKYNFSLLLFVTHVVSVCTEFANLRRIIIILDLKRVLNMFDLRRPLFVLRSPGEADRTIKSNYQRTKFPGHAGTITAQVDNAREK